MNRRLLDYYTKRIAEELKENGGGTGPQGPAGEPGHTPEKGVDYWTEEDKAEIVADVLAALPNGDEVAY